MNQTPDLETYAAGLLAAKLDNIARILDDAADHTRRRAEAVRGRPGQTTCHVGYRHDAAMVLNAVHNAVPNMGLAQAFEYASLADQARAEKAQP